ncbi:membrane protein [Oscillospiraceae bacterium]|nr:membrane protein [Oscillospiraceae bacterium]BDF73433.1 membrane protein [Oscillospiraceae bacterium]
MIATVINVCLVLVGSLLGILFKNKISARFAEILTCALGLCVLGIGVSSMIGTRDTLCVILCMVAGTLLGEGLNIERRMDSLGEILRRRLMRGQGSSRFVEGFVTASVLFCVGAMAINGSMEAGISQKYDILISKGVIDGVTAITFAAAMGVGVAFSAVPLLLYQGGLTLIFAAVGQGMPQAVITEMSAVGGTIIVGIALNMLGLPKEKIRVGNMLPAIFLPILYIPLAEKLGGLLG